jgi:hypothetical protein
LRRIAFLTEPDTISPNPDWLIVVAARVHALEQRVLLANGHACGDKSARPSRL